MQYSRFYVLVQCHHTCCKWQSLWLLSKPVVMQEMPWQLQLASLVQEAVEAITPVDNTAVRSPSAILSAVLDPLSTRLEQQASRTLLAAGLCQVMGFGRVLLRDTPRYAPPASVLCDKESHCICTIQVLSILQNTSCVLGSSALLLELLLELACQFRLRHSPCQH